MKLLYLIIAVGFIQPSQTKDPFLKFIGTWKREGQDFFEVWEKRGETMYRSNMCKVRNGDTTILETVETFWDGFGWVYSVTGAGNDTTVVFRCAAVTDSSVVFNNPLHDFPQEIHYLLARPDRLQAFIVGGKDTVRFNFVKQ